MVMVSGEDEMRKLLEIRQNLDNNIRELEGEIRDLRKAIAEIDRSIVRQGFRNPVPPKIETQLDSEDKGISVKSKDGVTLGYMRIDDEIILFKPVESLAFTISIPPFQAFFLERVLGNMKATDEAKAAGGETPFGEVLSFEVETDSDRITGITIRNFGDERRLREIQSSLRWALDKMYEKLIQN